MSGQHGLRFGPLTHGTAHLCIDMQRLFATDTDWHTPWMERVLPVVRRLAAAHPEATVYTRFVTPQRAEDATGTWRRYYERWRSVTGERLQPGMLDLVPELAAHAAKGKVIDKTTLSPWTGPELQQEFQRRGVDTLVISGAETDVCVLAAVLGAVDLGYRVVIPTDAICSSSDRTHDALLTLYRERFGQQIETADTDEILAAWN